MALGRAIKQARERRNLPQTQLGELADVDAATISIMEKRDAKRSVYAAALADALQVSLSDLLQGRVVEQGELPLYHNDQRINELTALFERLTTSSARFFCPRKLQVLTRRRNICRLMPDICLAEAR